MPVNYRGFVSFFSRPRVSLFRIFIALLILCGMGFYYDRYFQWRVCSFTQDGVVYISDVGYPQRNDFRRSILVKICNPALETVAAYKQLKKECLEGTVAPSEFKRRVTALRRETKELYTDARLRSVPANFREEHGQIFGALKKLYRSLLILESTYPQAGTRYNEGVKLSGPAERDLREARHFFFFASTLR